MSVWLRSPLPKPAHLHAIPIQMVERVEDSLIYLNGSCQLSLRFVARQYPCPEFPPEHSTRSVDEWSPHIQPNPQIIGQSVPHRLLDGEPVAHRPVASGRGSTISLSPQTV